MRTLQAQLSPRAVPATCSQVPTRSRARKRDLGARAQVLANENRLLQSHGTRPGKLHFPEAAWGWTPLLEDVVPERQASDRLRRGSGPF